MGEEGRVGCRSNLVSGGGIEGWGGELGIGVGGIHRSWEEPLKN